MDQFNGIVVIYNLHLDEWLRFKIRRLDRKMDRMYRENLPDLAFLTRPLPQDCNHLVRGIEGNAARSFPGNPWGNYEERQMWFITTMTQKARLVIDIHGNTVPGCDFAALGVSALDDPLARGVASLMKSDYVVVLNMAGNPGRELAVPYVALDFGLGSAAFRHLEAWLVDLALGWIPKTRPMTELQYHGVTLEQARSAGLPDTYPPFQALPESSAHRLNLEPPVIALDCDGIAHGHTGFWGEVGTRYARTPFIGTPRSA